MEAPFLALHRFARLIALINLGIYAAAFADEFGFYGSVWFPVFPFALACGYVILCPPMRCAR